MDGMLNVLSALLEIRIPGGNSFEYLRGRNYCDVAAMFVKYYELE